MGKYQLFKQLFEYAPSNENFFDIQYRLWQAMDSATCEFDAWYEECNNILTVLKGYEKKSYELVIKYANKPLFADLPYLEIYDISEDSYDEDCFSISNSDDALDKVATAYNKIIEQQEVEESYRAERKAGRSRVVGGGFGVSGSIKGMATADAMNLLSGAGHTLVNAIGNASSAIEAASSKRALYNNASTKAVLRNGIIQDIISSFDAHIVLINRIKHNYFVSCFDRDKATALLENAKKLPTKRIELLCESFKHCPYNPELLKYIFTNYKSERKNVWTISERYHVDLSETAESCFSDMYSSDTEISEEEAQNIKADILSQMKELGIKSSETINQIEKDGVYRILNDYDNADETTRKSMFTQIEKYNATDDNKAFIIHSLGVWELATRYNVIFNNDEIESILARLYTDEAHNDEKTAMNAKSKIRIVMDTLGVESSKVFDKLETDCIERLCPDIISSDEGKCNEMLTKIAEYDALDKNKQPFIQNIHKRIEAIWSAEDGEIFDNVYLNTNICNKEDINKSIDFITAKKRTSSSDKYIIALKNCNDDNIKKARNFQLKSTKIALFAAIGIIALGFMLLFLELGILLSFAVVALGTVLLVYYFTLKKAWDSLTLNGTIIHSMISLTGESKRSIK